MVPIEDTSVKITNYKCFTGEAQGFEGLAKVNLIIGRNNSGKSSLLDLLQSSQLRSLICRYGTLLARNCTYEQSSPMSCSGPPSLASKLAQ
jgi:recombinational DNA repair ATPase RecF